jgi:hypothetical protein
VGNAAIAPRRAPLLNSAGDRRRPDRVGGVGPGGSPTPLEHNA